MDETAAPAVPAKKQRASRRRTPDQEFYDVFADMPIAEQGIALRILSSEYRQSQRRAKRQADQGGAGGPLDEIERME